MHQDRIKSYYYSRFPIPDSRSKVSDEELDKIEPILSKLGLTREEILALDTEKKISNQVKARLDRLDKRIQDEIIQELQDCLDQDEYFEIDYKY
ncbi:MAG: hypothetical protein F6K37_09090 [Moorea sp. SIO4E2]|uniref:hypothetical protein n=1 Tax=Moorena sp. SIO4E2 TaxID=2607826 RepID=UPI0013BA574A|nr:hypothetical protein [Moorena sp. SIO4E2]NEQ06090.1 hypothetical protein [Moorena sp. SIO4E2]